MEVSSEFTYYRRDLQHWQVGGSSYFITFRSLRLLRVEERDCVKKRVLLGHNKKFTLFFGVVMTDHVHLLLQPLEKVTREWYFLPEILRGIKGSSAKI